MLTSIFVHVDPVHLLANALVLAGAGPAVERTVGSWKFVLVFLVGGLVGVFVHWGAVVSAMPAIAPEPLYGASGAIAALIGYAWLRFYRSKIPILPGKFIPLWSLVLIWICLQAAGGVFAVTQFGATIAYWSHVGGFVCGFVLGFVLRAHAAAENEALDEHLVAAATEGAGKSASTAAQVVKTRPKDTMALKQLYESSLRIGDSESAKGALIKLLPLDPLFASPRLSESGWLRDAAISERGRIANTLVHSSPETAELLWHSILEESNSTETPHALYGLISLGDSATARVYASRLAQEFALSPQAEQARKNWPELFR